MEIPNAMKRIEKIKWKTDLEIQPGFGVIQFSKKYNLVYFVTSNPGSIVFNNESLTIIQQV